MNCGDYTDNFLSESNILYVSWSDGRPAIAATAMMIFGVLDLVHYLSQFMTLDPGDVISTDAPPGVGFE